MGPPGREVRADYLAAEELIRDFHAARRPVVLRRLGREAATALCREAVQA
jgi:hypothetical protein